MASANSIEHKLRFSAESLSKAGKQIASYIENHIDHVSTQIPYAITVAVSCAVGYLVSAFTGFSVVATLGSGLLTLAILLFVINKLTLKKNSQN